MNANFFGHRGELPRPPQPVNVKRVFTVVYRIRQFDHSETLDRRLRLEAWTLPGARMLAADYLGAAGLDWYCIDAVVEQRLAVLR